jgi:hypothetical protein
MHDLDRTFNEFESGFDPNPGRFEMEFWQGESTPQPRQAVFDEMDEMELAASLLEVGSDQEMEQFLGNLFRKASSAIGSAIRSPVGQAIGGVLKNVARQALPVAGAALGNLIVPGAGGAIGGQLASAAGQALGLELEGMSPQDQEFEVARRIVRLTGEAAKNAAQLPPTVPPVQAARTALLSAAQQVAPALAGVIAQAAAGAGAGNGRGAGSGVLGTGAGQVPGGAQSGRWVRRGNRILLLGV